MGALDFLREKKPAHLDAPETTLHHRNIVLRKKFLYKIYKDWYNYFVAASANLPAQGKLVEIGSGGGFLKDMLPNVITSDIMPLQGVDMTFAAEKMPFADNELSGIFMVNVLHHIPQCRSFFTEAQRTLMRGGEIIMIEPSSTFMARLIYKYLHHEPFDHLRQEWEFPSAGPLSDANGALPYMVFVRDVDMFHAEFTKLRVYSFRYIMPIRYLLSGGLSFKTPFPGWSYGVVKTLEHVFYPILPMTAMFQVIKVQKI